MRYVLILSFLNLLGITRLLGQDINFKTSILQSKYSDEQWPGIDPVHVGYSGGFEVVVADGNTMLIPGLIFQKTSIYPEKFDVKKPYQEFIDIKTLKLPVHLGGYVFHNKYAELRLQGGPFLTFLLGIDTNDALVEEDFSGVKGGVSAQATLRILFLTLHVGYDYGLSKVYVDENPSGFLDKSKENALSFGIGFQF